MACSHICWDDRREAALQSAGSVHKHGTADTSADQDSASDRHKINFLLYFTVQNKTQGHLHRDTLLFVVNIVQLSFSS